MNTESKESSINIERLLNFLDEQPKPVCCKLCGRPLSDEASVTAGIGPICAEKADAEEGDSE